MSYDKVAQGAYLLWPSGAPDSFAYFDCVLNEQVTLDSEITDHPVEKGADISDNQRPALNVINLQGFVSQVPIKTVMSPGVVQQTTTVPVQIPTNFYGGILGSLGTLLFGTTTQLLSVSPVTTASPVDFVQNMFEILKDLRDASTLVSVITPYQIFYDMLVKTIKITGDADNGIDRVFDVEFKQLRLVQSTTTKAPLPSLEGPQTPPKLSKGGQAPAPPTEAQKKSAATAIIDLANK